MKKENLCVPCFSYLKDLDGIGPFELGVLPRFTISQALCKHIQIEDSIVFRVLDLTLKLLHDDHECLQGPADIYDCRWKRKQIRGLSQSLICFCEI